MGKALLRNKTISTFFGELQVKGEKRLVDFKQKQNEEPRLFYKHPNGQLWQGNSINWLKSLEAENFAPALKQHVESF